MSTIRIPDENMKFKTVRIIDLREDAMYQLILQGHMTLQNFTSWVEATRDQWYAIGANSVNVEKECQEEQSSSRGIHA